MTGVFNAGVKRPVDDVPVQPLGVTWQLVALLDVQLIVAFELKATMTGPSDPLARMSTSGTCGAAETLTTTLSVAFPPGPVQDTLNVVEAVSGPVVTPGPLVPVQPPGVTVQLVALVDVQLIVAAVL